MLFALMFIKNKIQEPIWWFTREVQGIVFQNCLKVTTGSTIMKYLWLTSRNKTIYEKEFDRTQCYHPVLLNEQYITKVNKDDITVMNKESSEIVFEIENKFGYNRYLNYNPLKVSRTELIQFDYGKALALSIENDGSYVWKTYYFNFWGV